jgi:hypothetical protein
MYRQTINEFHITCTARDRSIKIGIKKVPDHCFQTPFTIIEQGCGVYRIKDGGKIK